MSDSVKIFLRDAKKHRFQIVFFWKSIDCRFLYQNFIDLCQIVCLLHGFEVTAKFPPQNWFPIEICLQSIFDLLSFLNDLSYRCEIGLVWKIIWCSFRNLTKSTNNFFNQDQSHICSSNRLEMRANQRWTVIGFPWEICSEGEI